ncbi:hypothetical protein [Bradyrhizobium sp.]|uniref:hypothetical protein n=1 Tax=Bradyrhizobium sp. TaxID=376 RepID=UPI0025BC191F|nr:hypothetical protein [Bradyrhizobium sp.]
MLKRLSLAFAGLFLLLTSAFGAGTISLSLSQQLDNLGKPLNGGKLYFFQAGTTTPQNAFSDTSLTLPLPNPITLDSAGRIPQFFLADGSIKIRLTNAAGVTQIAADGILVIGASSGGGGGSPVDATTVLTTGDLKARYGTGSLTGFVRANGRTVGSATSGATERANADAQALFEYLWSIDPNLVVSTGRGASANADWVANKTIALPDWRGRALAGLDDMGNSAAGVLTPTYFGSTAVVLGAIGGSQSHTLSVAQVPALTFSGTTGTNNVGHTHSVPASNGQTYAVNAGSFTGIGGLGQNSGGESQNHNHPFSGTTTGGGGAHPTITPTKLATFYIKL